MTNEEAKVFLDNLKICIEEHPIIADWLIEIADRKTEPQKCDDCIWSVCNYNKVDWERAEQTEPQYDIDKGTIKCDNCSENGSYKCSKCDGEMYFKRLEAEDEPQSLEQFRVGLEYHTDITHFGKVKGESITTNKVEDEPQTERSE